MARRRTTRRSPHSPVTPAQQNALRADLVAWYTTRDEAALVRVLDCLGDEWTRRFSRVREGEVEDLTANVVLKKLLDCEGTPLLPTRPDVCLMAHIRTVIGNACIDAHRKAERDRRKGTPMDAQDLDFRADCLAADGWEDRSTERIVEAREALRETFAALHRVPAVRRMAFVIARELYTVPGFRSELELHARDFARVRGESTTAVLARIDDVIESMSAADELRVVYPYHHEGHPDTKNTIEAFTRSARRAAEDLHALLHDASGAA